MNYRNRSNELLKKFIADKCTSEELEELFLYLKRPEHKADHSQVLQEVWEKLHAGKVMDEDRSEAIFQKIITARLSQSRPLPRKTVWTHKIQVAASLAGLMLVAAIAGYFLLKENTIRYQTAYGQTRVILLPDSSQVTLNANSTLSYRADWPNASERGDVVRQVWLAGEAFFEVQEVATPSQEKVKFLVHTPQLAIEVVGTAFNVDSRRDQTQVVLNSGKVNLYLPTEQQKAIEMEPGDLVEYSKTKQVLQRVVEPDQYSSWKDRRLTFVDTPVREIAQILEDTYGFEVVIRDQAIAEKRFNGEVGTDQISLLLKALASSFNITITQNENRIVMQNN